MSYVGKQITFELSKFGIYDALVCMLIIIGTNLNQIKKIMGKWNTFVYVGLSMLSYSFISRKS